MFEAFARYDNFKSIHSRAVAIHQDGFHRTLGLRDAEALFQLQSILEDAVTTIEAVGARMGFALVYAKEKGRELVVLAAIKDTEKGISMLELTRRTGDPLRDLLPVGRNANWSFLERVTWGGGRRKVDVAIRPKPGTETALSGLVRMSADTITDTNEF